MTRKNLTPNRLTARRISDLVRLLPALIENILPICHHGRRCRTRLWRPYPHPDRARVRAGNWLATA